MTTSRNIKVKTKIDVHTEVKEEHLLPLPTRERVFSSHIAQNHLKLPEIKTFQKRKCRQFADDEITEYDKSSEV